MPDKRFLGILILLVILIISLPYLIGFLASDNQAQFGGFLINPVDGHSYLSKILQGVRGEWKFKLPYTAEPGEGAYLFLFYLGLGHLGRLIQLPGIALFHITRVLSAIWLIWVMSKLFRALFPDTRAIKAGLILSVFGSGLGWIAILGGAFTSDFWVAEAYPFLSMYTNPHFVIGLGFIVYSLLPEIEERLLPSMFAGLMLAIIQPFAVVIVSLVKIISSIWTIIEERLKIKQLLSAKWFWATAGFGISGGSILIYQFWVINSDPILAQWNQQNITLRPEPLDLLISLSPCLILSAIGIVSAWKDRAGRTMVFWAGISLLLVFVPWSLQRRFLTGIYVPLVGLSIFGIQYLAANTQVKFRRWALLVLLLSIPTNLIVITSGLQAISERNPKIFLEGNLEEGLQWIEANSPETSLVLADAETGLYVPSQTGRRVIYGHPFETIQAEEEKALLAEIYGQKQSDQYYREMLDRREINYVLINAELAPDFNHWLEKNWLVGFQEGKVLVYTRQDE
jgi:hypothetical protein